MRFDLKVSNDFLFTYKIVAYHFQHNLYTTVEMCTTFNLYITFIVHTSTSLSADLCRNFSRKAT